MSSVLPVFPQNRKEVYPLELSLARVMWQISMKLLVPTSHCVLPFGSTDSWANVTLDPVSMSSSTSLPFILIRLVHVTFASTSLVPPILPSPLPKLPALPGCKFSLMSCSGSVGVNEANTITSSSDRWLCCLRSASSPLLSVEGLVGR